MLTHIELNTYIRKLDDHNVKKLGNQSNRCVKRIYGDLLDGSPPKKLPRSMVDPASQQPHQEFQASTPYPCGSSMMSHSIILQAVPMNYTPQCTVVDDYGPMYSFDSNPDITMYD